MKGGRDGIVSLRICHASGGWGCTPTHPDHRAGDFGRTTGPYSDGLRVLILGTPPPGRKTGRRLKHDGERGYSENYERLTAGGQAECGGGGGRDLSEAGWAR